VPAPAQGLDASVTQLHSSEYRNPDALPDGPVLVVGGGNSGFQIAEELAAAGRRADLSVATKAPMLPQRLAGNDLFWWLTRLGLMRMSVTSRLGGRMSTRPDFVMAAAAAGSKPQGSGSGRGWPVQTGAPPVSGTEPRWRPASSSGLPASAPTTPGSASRA